MLPEQAKAEKDTAVTKTIKTSDLRVRDPFILTDTEHGKYYLYCYSRLTDGTPGIACHESSDLENWSEAIDAFRPSDMFKGNHYIWAPEVHFYRGKYYMFVTLGPKDGFRSTWALRSDSPKGPFVRFSEKPLTPENWQCLDGTLFCDKAGKPYLIFCHEWVQICNGTICAVPLKEDLSGLAGRPIFLFAASEAPWSAPINQDKKQAAYRTNRITDGPWVHRTADGRLLMLWSSQGYKGYALGVAESADGTLLGEWRQQAEPLFGDDGGHGMIFRDLKGNLRLAIHYPNTAPKERALFPVLKETGKGFELVGDAIPKPVK